MELSEYLKTEMGQEEANSFIKALRERRIFSVQRKAHAEYDLIDFYKIDAGHYYPYCINAFLERFGMKISGRNRNIRVNGAQLDLSNHAITVVKRKLHDNGFDIDTDFANINRL